MKLVANSRTQFFHRLTNLSITFTVDEYDSVHGCVLRMGRAKAKGRKFK